MQIEYGGDCADWVVMEISLHLLLMCSTLVQLDIDDGCIPSTFDLTI